MSNPTSNFGWQMPTATDLVTDLPADFEVFGQAVDSSMADLKGGTTGQILSKASATDMDFTWITNDVGDITAVTATTPLTGGGTSGAITVGIQDASTSQKGSVQLSDSTSTTSSILAATPTAVKSAYDLAASAYAPAFTNNYYAGKNKIINGDFFVNQRNFTSNTTDDSYNFDRWFQSNSGGTVTVTPQTFTLGAAPVSGYEANNYVRVVTASQTLSSHYTQYRQKIENVRTFAGQTVTLSFWAKASTGTPKIAPMLAQYFGSGGSPSANVNTTGTSVTLSTSWARYTATIAVPSISGKTLGTTNNSYLGVTLWLSAGGDYNSLTNSLGLQNATIDIWGVQLEQGSTATPFQTATGTVQGELAACQRYYVRFNSATTYQNFGSGVAYNTTNAYIAMPLPVEMRVVPTALDSTAGSTFRLQNSGNTTMTAIALGTIPNGKTTGSILATVASGLTSNNFYFCMANADTSAYVGFSAEL